MLRAMELKADARIPFPRTLVYETYRDRLPELVPYLPDIASIAVESREEGVDGNAGQSRLVNRWRAKGDDVPKVAQAVIKPEMLGWLDHALWDQDAWRCDWRIETQMFTENIRCSGSSVYEERDGSTMLRIRGDLDVSLSGVPGVPRFLASRVAPHVEKYIVQLLTPNLLAVATGLERFLEQQGNG